MQQVAVASARAATGTGDWRVKKTAIGSALATGRARFGLGVGWAAWLGCIFIKGLLFNSMIAGHQSLFTKPFGGSLDGTLLFDIDLYRSSVFIFLMNSLLSMTCRSLCRLRSLSTSQL